MEVYTKCMAVKTITIDIESFSKVIKRTLGEEGKTGKNLLLHLNKISLSDEYLSQVEDMVAEPY